MGMGFPLYISFQRGNKKSETTNSGFEPRADYDRCSSREWEDETKGRVRARRSAVRWNMYPTGSGRHVVYAVHFVLFASAYKESHSSPDKEPLDTAPSLPGYLVLRPPDSLVALFVFRSQKNWKLRHKWFVLSPRGFLCLFVGGEKVHLDSAPFPPGSSKLWNIVEIRGWKDGCAELFEKEHFSNSLLNYISWLLNTVCWAAIQMYAAL